MLGCNAAEGNAVQDDILEVLLYTRNERTGCLNKCLGVRLRIRRGTYISEPLNFRNKAIIILAVELQRYQARGAAQSHSSNSGPARSATNCCADSIKP